jgi:hypothetical protein
MRDVSFESLISVSLQRRDSNDPTNVSSPPGTGTGGDGQAFKETPDRALAAQAPA